MPQRMACSSYWLGSSKLSGVLQSCGTLRKDSILILIFQGLILSAGRMVAQRAIILIVIVSIIAGFSTYGLARAAEPLFPSPSAPAEEHHHDEGTSAEDHHNVEVTPMPEHDH